MLNYESHVTDLRLLFPEVIWLESEHFQQARKMSNQVRSETQQWQTYLNTLALSAFAEWLREKISDQTINSEPNLIETICQLKVGDFKLDLIATEHILDEVVHIPQSAIARPDLAAHFYVVLEVAEEQEEVIIRGFLRYDELVNYREKYNLQPSQDGCYQLPISLFDAESNHLLFYCRHLEPSAIALPVASIENTQDSLISVIESSRAKLSQWLEGIFDPGWLSIDELLGSEANLAWSTRERLEGAKGGKLIDLGMELGNYTVAMLLTITPEDSEKLGIQVQLSPTEGERYLPPNIQLTLYSQTGKKLQSTQSREQDNYIQLKPFKGKEGICFSVEVSIGDISVIEDFEL
ncbi:MAG: DUF1822 family protein [Cyanobacteria bacterium P01_F01_bin.143]